MIFSWQQRKVKCIFFSVVKKNYLSTFPFFTFSISTITSKAQRLKKERARRLWNYQPMKSINQISNPQGLKSPTHVAMASMPRCSSRLLYPSIVRHLGIQGIHYVACFPGNSRLLLTLPGIQLMRDWITDLELGTSTTTVVTHIENSQCSCYFTHMSFDSNNNPMRLIVLSS